MNQVVESNAISDRIPWIERFSQPVNKTPMVEELLDISWWFVVYVDDSKVSINLHENEFYASFPITIDDNWFIIIISWNNKLLEDWLIKWRRHPFLNNPFNIKHMSPLDIKSGMNFDFQKIGSTEVIRTNDQFWKQLRQRISSSHPLSLNIRN